MRYINFITNRVFKAKMIGSTEDRLCLLEEKLGLSIPLALREYLLLMGEKTNLYTYWDEHGTNDLIELYDCIYEWISDYRNEGILLAEIQDIIPFYKFQDTFFMYL